jgi:hypothetical protein
MAWYLIKHRNFNDFIFTQIPLTKLTYVLSILFQTKEMIDYRKFIRSSLQRNARQLGNVIHHYGSQELDLLMWKFRACLECLTFKLTKGAWPRSESSHMNRKYHCFQNRSFARNDARSTIKNTGNHSIPLDLPFPVGFLISNLWEPGKSKNNFVYAFYIIK